MWPARKVLAIVLHDLEGSLSAGIAWFQNPASGVSAHYIVARDGQVIQMVKDEDIAFHVRGTPSMYPAWLTALPSPGLTSKPNGYSIGIELELEPGQSTYLESQLAALTLLVEGLIVKYRIPWNPEHVLGHGEIQDDRSDPRAFPWSEWRYEMTRRLFDRAMRGL